MVDPRAPEPSTLSDAPPLADGEKGVVLQRDRKTYAIAPHLPCGVVTADILRRIAEVADRYGCQAIKVTSAERIAIIGIKPEDVESAWADLELPKGGLIGNQVRSVKVCPGTTFCKRGQQDSIAIGMELDRRHHGQPLPGKLKIGVSGCPNQCAETCVKDIGLVGTRRGWDLYLGGSAGASPRLATRVTQGLSDDAAIAMVGKVVEFFEQHAKAGERLGKTLARLGFQTITDYLGLPALVESTSPQSTPSTDSR